MKIIPPPELAPIRPEWIGLRLQCDHCQHILELEETDQGRVRSTIQHGEPTLELHCPSCGHLVAATWIAPKPPPQPHPDATEAAQAVPERPQ